MTNFTVHVNASLKHGNASSSQVSNYTANYTGPKVLTQYEDPLMVYANDTGLVVMWYILAFILLVGVIGNLLAFIVLSRYRHKTGTTYILTFLALVDLCLVIFQIFRYPVFESRWISYSQTSLAVVHLGFLHCQLMSIWTVVYLSLDRYIAICHPYSAIRMCSVGRAKRGIIFIFIASFVYYSVRTYDLLFATKAVQEKKWYGKMNYIINTVIDTAVILVVPLVMLFFLNIRLMVAINRARKRRMSLSNGPSSEKSSVATRLAPTINVVAVVTLFLITQVPNVIIFFVIKTGVVSPHHEPHTMLWLRLQSVKNILVALNSSLNFLIYCLFYRKFREQVKALFRCRRGFGRMGRGYENHYKMPDPTSQSTRLSLASEQMSEL